MDSSIGGHGLQLFLLSLYCPDIHMLLASDISIHVQSLCIARKCMLVNCGGYAIHCNGEVRLN